jgi:hypothetical protein
VNLVRAAAKAAEPPDPVAPEPVAEPEVGGLVVDDDEEVLVELPPHAVATAARATREAAKAKTIRFRRTWPG